jgi:hypothetical protein
MASLLKTMLALGLGYVLLLAYLHFQSQSEVHQIFGGSRGTAIMNHADRVEAYRIDMPADRNTWSTAGLADYPILKGPLPVSPSDIETILTTFGDRESYDWQKRKACIFVPGVRLDFVRSDDRLSVLICFDCDMITSYLNGKIVGGSNTDKCRPALVRLAKSLFPDDAKIQSLGEKR